MQENDSSVVSSAPTPKPTKYRLSCDSCQHSKIRCDQERPKCRRCAKKGIECVYSPARRAGRPRTRNNSKGPFGVENSASTSQTGYLTPMSEHGITISASSWMSPFAPPSMMSISENCSSSTTSSIPAHTIQLLRPNDTEFSPYHQSDEDFLQGLLDVTASQCSTPKQTINCYYPMSPEFHLSPELLDLGICGVPWEQQQQQHEHRIHHPTSSSTLSDEGLPYYRLPTPVEHQQRHHPDQHQEDTPIPTIGSHNIESCSYKISSQQQVQSQLPQPLDQVPLSTRSCNYASILLNHLSMPSHALSSSSLGSTSAALSTSRVLIARCRTIMACPNACTTRPSTALIICEAIDRALISLKLGGTTLWTPTLAPVPSYEKETSSSSSPSSSSSSSSTSTSRGSSADTMLPPSVVDEEHEPLRCGTLRIRGADRQAVVRVLLLKRALELQGVLERLRDTLLSGLLVGGDTAVKNPLLALCADLVGEFTRKVSERVETEKLQI